MTREKIGKAKDYDSNEKELTLELTGKISEGDKVAVLGPVAYQPSEVKEVDKEKGKITLEKNIEVRENTTVYRLE